MCDINYSIFFVTDFILHMFHATEKMVQHGRVFDFVTVFSFCCGSYVSCVCVEHNTQFCYMYNFVHKCCVFHLYITIAVFNGRQLPIMLCCRVHVAAQGTKSDTFQVSKESSAVCS